MEVVFVLACNLDNGKIKVQRENSIKDRNINFEDERYSTLPYIAITNKYKEIKSYL